MLNLSLKADVAARWVGGAAEAAGWRLQGGQFLAERVTLGQNVFTGVSGNLAADKGRIAITHGASSAAEGTITGEASFSSKGRLETLHLGFNEAAQQALLRHLYPGLLTAEGVAGGTLTLARGDGPPGILAGALEWTAERPGRLLLSRAAAAAVAGDAAAPGVIGQLADYPYATGKATFVDEADGGTAPAADHAGLSAAGRRRGRGCVAGGVSTQEYGAGGRLGGADPGGLFGAERGGRGGERTGAVGAPGYWPPVWSRVAEASVPFSKTRLCAAVNPR